MFRETLAHRRTYLRDFSTFFPGDSESEKPALCEWFKLKLIDPPLLVGIYFTTPEHKNIYMIHGIRGYQKVAKSCNLKNVCKYMYIYIYVKAMRSVSTPNPHPPSPCWPTRPTTRTTTLKQHPSYLTPPSNALWTWPTIRSQSRRHHSPPRNQQSSVLGLLEFVSKWLLRLPSVLRLHPRHPRVVFSLFFLNFFVSEPFLLVTVSWQRKAQWGLSKVRTIRTPGG